jgi:hypothetical protein
MASVSERVINFVAWYSPSPAPLASASAHFLGLFVLLIFGCLDYDPSCWSMLMNTNSARCESCSNHW